LVALPLASAGQPAWAQSAIQAPGTVDPGQPMAVTVAAGQGAGTLELWGPETGSGPAGLVGAYPVQAGAAALSAPAAPGTYELRYLDPAGRLLARRSFDVAAPPVTLSAPLALGPGHEARIVWRGPGAPGDMIQIYDPASRQVLAEAPAVGSPGASNTTLIRTPEWRGPAQLRYWHGAARVALRSLEITIGAGTGWLRVPIEVTVGERFTVEWRDAPGTGLVYELADPATGTALQRVPATDASGATVAGRLTAPQRAGHYRVRMVSAETGFVISDLPLDVDAR
jgi:hypothetical protein